MNPTDLEFQLLRDFLLRETGIDVPESKRYLFATRLSAVLEKVNCRSYSDLLLKLGAREETVVRSTIEAMTTHESGFFREPHHFETLFDQFLPMLLDRRAEHSPTATSSLRFLSAGCSFGQEAYTMAIGVERWMEKNGSMAVEDISIVGVDLSEKALERARLGSYTDLELGPCLANEDRERYFSRKGEYWNLSPSIRGRVSFRSANLTQPLSGLGMFDVIFCRNVIIYFPADRKVAVLERLRAAMNPDGALFIGSSESLYRLEVAFGQRTYGQSTYYEILNSHPMPEEVPPWKS